jgi:hypothetical protein
VFGSNSWGVNLFFVPIMILVALTWMVHKLCRKYNLLAESWRWVQVGLTFFCMGVIVKVISSFVFKGGNGFQGFDQASWKRFLFLSQILDWGLILLAISQLVFWLMVTILLIIKVRSAKTRKQV